MTINAGVIQGGTKPNVVCEEATAKIDVRYVNDADLDRLLKSAEKIRTTNFVKNPSFHTFRRLS